MKPKIVIGTVAGLISLATAAKGDIMISPITNQLLNISGSGGNDVDINGDSTVDFRIIYTNSSFRVIEGLNGNLVAVDGSFSARRYSLSETILFTDPTEFQPDINNLLGLGTSYLGFSFTAGSTTNAGWMEVNYPDATPTNGILVRAAWESDAATDIVAGVIPEPNTATLSFFGILAAWFLNLFRRKPHETKSC